MLKIFNVDQIEEAQATLLKRHVLDEFPITETMRQRTRATFGEDLHPEEVVRRILRDVRQRGDDALLHWSKLLDGAEISAEQLQVSEEDIAASFDKIDSEVGAALERAAERIEGFHLHHPAKSWWNTEMGGVLGQVIRPLERVGLYVPGGSAPLASTVLMTALVARAAGVDDIVLCSPPMRGSHLPHPVVLAAAAVADVDSVFAIGGVQAIGAMAYGTDSIERVDKIFGPGNTFVVLAKRQVFGTVGIDALPGPTETVIVADDSANPVWIAADLLAQAEHTGGSAILLTPSKSLANKVKKQVAEQLKAIEQISPINAADIRDSLANRSGAVITEDLLEAVAFADNYAPEHLCLSVREPWAWVGKIRHAGGIFVGEQSFEVLGDYCAGPSHVMPTGGTARFTPPCNVLDFMRVMNVIALDSDTARQLSPIAVKLAEAEGLNAHAQAARMRL